jgi:hypothetical protein
MMIFLLDRRKDLPPHAADHSIAVVEMIVVANNNI